MGSPDFSLLASGIYTFPQAARLLGMPSQQINRWMTHRKVKSKTGEREVKPLWEPHVPAFGDKPALSFLDLMELRLIGELVGAEQLRIADIRLFIENLRGLPSDFPHPLLNRQITLQTDGKKLYARSRGGEWQIDLSSNQYVLTEILKESLKDLDFDGGDLPTRWWPLRKAGAIVVNPEHEFGAPILSASGIPTSAIMRSLKSGNDISAIARIYEVDIVAVSAAVEFERELDGRRVMAS
jgi:uncharacterized protein (DUF433 family)